MQNEGETPNELKPKEEAPQEFVNEHGVQMRTVTQDELRPGSDKRMHRRTFLTMAGLGLADLIKRKPDLAKSTASTVINTSKNVVASLTDSSDLNQLNIVRKAIHGSSVDPTLIPSGDNTTAEELGKMRGETPQQIAADKIEGKSIK